MKNDLPAKNVPHTGGRGSRRAANCKRVSRPLALSLLPLLLTGCIVGRQNPAATQPATTIDPKSAQPAYWLAQPAVEEVTSNDFDKLWAACRDTLVADGFTIDRTDYRDGVLTTLPQISKQVYELWKNDVVDPHGLAQSTLGTMRRTARFDVRRLPDGSFRATPRVVVDRYSMLAKRITSVAQYRMVFSLTAKDLRLSAEEEEGAPIPSEYWYAVGRDHPLEHHLAATVRNRLR